MKILFSLLICNLIEVFAINPHPSHFKIIPLNFYTPDNRNDKYFKDSNFYGVRLGWIASYPPSESIIINSSSSCLNIRWQNTGIFNIHKNEWGTELWKYAFSDLALPIGKTIIQIRDWIYQINIPSFGRNNGNDDTTLFVGDPNIGPKSKWALGSADIVIKSKLLEYTDQVSMVVWLGDIFYHDNPAIITKEWPSLTENRNGHILGVPNYYRIAIPGNHDYSSNTACHSCKWYIQRDNMLCTNNNDVSAAWIPYVFLSDGLKSFNNELSNIYHRGCRVPYEFTFQVKVLGRTGYLTIDNTWAPSEVKIDWTTLSDKLNNYIDTIILIGHWDYINSGAKSGVSDWISYLYKYFQNKKIIGVQGHTHVNNIQHVNKYDHNNHRNINYQLITAGGNGFRGSGCNCKDTCYNCDCCCPSLYKNNNWIIGGWKDNQLCGKKMLSYIKN